MFGTQRRRRTWIEGAPFGEMVYLDRGQWEEIGEMRVMEGETESRRKRKRATQCRGDGLQLSA